MTPMTLSRRLKKFLGWRMAALANGFKDATAYRVEFLLEILGYAAVPATIQFVLWHALYKVGGATQIAGFTYDQMISYTIASVLFSQVRGGDHDFELAEMIRSGQLSNYLLRPVGVIEFVYARGAASRYFVAGICFLLGTILLAMWGLNPWRMVGAMFLAVLGNIIHFQVGTALAATSFYWEEAYSVLMVKNVVVGILSGEMIPLTLFPSQYQWIWKSTPFYLYVFGPTQFALGHWDLQQYLNAVAIAIAWIVGCTLLIKLTWGMGMKKYISLGG